MKVRIKVAAAAFILTLVAAVPAQAFFVKDGPTSNLDGKTVLSPAAERISTMKADGGNPIGPGSNLERMVLLQNRNDETIEFTLSLAQIVGAGAEKDVVEVRNGVLEGAAAWAQLERNSVKVKPGQTVGVKISIAIPQAVKPGSKAFAVTATQQSTQAPTSGAGVTPIFRQVAIFIVDLPGDAPVKGNLGSGSIMSTQKGRNTPHDVSDDFLPFVTSTGSKRGKLTANVTYFNKGERLLNPEIKLEVRDIFGRVVKRYTGEQKVTVYPEGGNAATIEMKGLPSWGILRFKATATSDAGKDSSNLGWTIMLPWWIKWAAIAASLYLLFRVAKYWIQSRNLLYGADIEWDEDDEDLDDEHDVLHHDVA